jgi:archaeal flagellar protein FlaJ
MTVTQTRSSVPWGRIFIPVPSRLVAALAQVLPRAGMMERPETYLATAVHRTGMVLFVGWSLALVLQVLITPSVLHSVLLWVAPILAALLVFGVLMVLPWNRAAERRKHIDARLPFALNYIATMAGAGMAPDRIFWSLGKQEVYGEVAVEAALISRDLRGLGVDLRSAFRMAIDRTPSKKMASLLQGAITTLSTGEKLGGYFLAKSKQFAYENRQEERRFLESMGVLAESYITLIVAAPIFLIILLSVMLVFGAGAEGMLTIGYILILVLIPTAQAFFAATMKSITPET